jgi:hypothetical protein
MQIDIDDVRNAVADALKNVGHGNDMFIRSIREGGQDDGPFMRGAFAVLNLIERRAIAPEPVSSDDAL